jgi:hypothetical protein
VRLGKNVVPDPKNLNTITSLLIEATGGESMSITDYTYRTNGESLCLKKNNEFDHSSQ